MPEFLTKKYKVSTFIQSGNMPSLSFDRKEKNFARADEIRDMLLEKGIILEDTREGVKWKRA